MSQLSIAKKLKEDHNVEDVFKDHGLENEFNVHFKGINILNLKILF